MRLVTHVQPVAFVRDGGGQAHGASASPRPTRDAKPIAGTEHEIPCDLVALAIGQSKLRDVAKLLPGVELDKRGCVACDPKNGQTGNPKVFAGGDCINGGKEVVNAVADGRNAARTLLERWASRLASALRRARERGVIMADLSIDFAGIKSPNPFWLASAPPANSGEQIMRAFDAGWGGAVWKTLGDPIVNVIEPLRRRRLRRPQADGAQQHRAHHRPSARGEPPRDPRGQEALPEARRHRRR